MADLPRYQPTGRVFADVPQLDFANVRESFKASQSMTNALDKLSDFAYKQAAINVETEAEKFSVENPITLEQIKQAQESGISSNDLITASKGGAIFEKTLRKMQGEQLRAQLEVHGQSALSDIMGQVNTGKLTNMQEIKQKFESAITGYEKPLIGINPESAVRFKQSMATTAHSFYKEAAKKLESDYRNDQQILSQVNFDNSIKATKSMIATITDPALLDETKNLLFKRVYEQAREGGTDFAQQQANKFLTEFDAIKLNHFTEVATSPKYASDIVGAAQKIRAGDFGDATPLYNSLTEEDKKKVRQNSLLAWSDVINATKQQESYIQIQNKEKDNNDVIRLYELPDNSKDKRNLARDLFKRGAITQSTLDSVLNPKSDDEAKGNPLDAAHAQADIIYGRITTEAQLNSLYPTLTRKQRADLIVTMSSKVVANVKARIRVAAGAAEDPMATIEPSTSARVQSITNIYDELRVQTNLDGTLKYSPNDAASEAIKQFPKTEAFETNKASQKSAFSAMQKSFPGFNPDIMSPEGFAKKANISKEEKTKLERQFKTYNSSKAITGLSGGSL
jgi:hypothetical protein